MSATISTRRNRVYVHKFDHDLARVMRFEGGLTWAEIAEELGVSATAIQRVCRPELDQAMRATLAAYHKSGTCIDCGGPCSSNPSDKHPGRPHKHCRACHLSRISRGAS